MKQQIIIYLTLIFALSLFSASAGAIGNTSMLASIMLNLNHYPSAAEKDKLRGVINDDTHSAYQKTIAQAMINMEHSASAADKSKLKTIIDDNSAPADERNLAAILYKLKHKPSSADKELLKSMIE